MKKLLSDFIKNKFFKETSWAVITKGLTFILYYATQFFLIANMSVEKWGQWSGFFSILRIILLISILGLNSSFKKHIAQYNNTNKIKNIISFSIKIRLIASFVYTLIILLCYKPLLAVLGKEELNSLFLISIPLVFLFGNIEYFKAIFEGLHRIKFNFFINSSEYISKLILVIVLFLTYEQLHYIVISFELASIITIILGFILLYLFFYRNYKSEPADKSENKQIYKSIIKYSIPMLIMVVGAYISVEIDTIMLSVIKGDYETGIYSTAKRLIDKLPQLGVVFGMGIIPAFAKLNEENKQRMKLKYYRGFKLVAFIFVLVCGGLLLFSRFIPFFFGERYIPSISVIMALIPYLFAVGISTFTAYLLDYVGLATKRAINLFVSIILNIILNYFFIKEWGAIGAAFATSISYMPYFILNLLEVRKVFK